MSLIITSSSQGLDETNQIGIAKPEQYKNHMKNSLIIEAGSEIAVESVKINRIPMLDAGAAIVANYWFGERLAKNVGGYGPSPLDKSLSYIIPTQNRIGRSVTPVDFADQYLNTLKEAYSLHPEIDSVNIEMNTKFSAGGVFEGYEYKIPQIGIAGSASSTSPPAATSYVVTIPTESNAFIAGAYVTWDGGDLEGEQGQFAQLQPRGADGGPIALNGGLIQYDPSDLDSWTVGLSRPYCQKVAQTSPVTDESGGEDSCQSPEEVFKPDEGGYGVGPFYSDYYDYCAEVATDGKLRLYHALPAAGSDSDAPYALDEGSGMRMTEIIYYEKNNTSFTAANTANSSFATGVPIVWAGGTRGVIVFETDGEKVKISVSGNVLCQASLVNASTKGQIPKPIAQTAWKMYPTVSFWEDDEPITIDKYTSRTSATIWNNQPENSWITKTLMSTFLDEVNGISTTKPVFVEGPNSNERPPWNNANFWGKNVDSRDMFVPYAAYNEAPAVPEEGGTIHTYQTIIAKVINDYENIFIVGNSQRYMDKALQQGQPNSGNILGFYPMGFTPIAGSMTANVGASFASAQRPSLMSQHTSFIRVPTFTHQTYNFGTGNPSKILFQVPRFDNAGTETGALYYQNNDKTYVDLNNAQQLNITELDVHIVRKNETFVEDLTGSTEIIFHVRKK